MFVGQAMIPLTDQLVRDTQLRVQLEQPKMPESDDIMVHAVKMHLLLYSDGFMPILRGKFSK